MFSAIEGLFKQWHELALIGGESRLDELKKKQKWSEDSHLENNNMNIGSSMKSMAALTTDDAHRFVAVELLFEFHLLAILNETRIPGHSFS